MYIPVVSFSIFSSLSSGNSSHFCILKPLCLKSPLVPPAELKNPSCPSIFSRRSLSITSKTSLKAISMVRRFSPKESSAPHFIRLSRARLLSSLPYIRRQKSKNDVNRPDILRSVMILSIMPSPRFLTPSRPYTIPSSVGVKYLLPVFTSGGYSFIPSFKHSAIYRETLGVLSSTLVSSAAINSRL